jgi:hypothetical protein
LVLHWGDGTLGSPIDGIIGGFWQEGFRSWRGSVESGQSGLELGRGKVGERTNTHGVRLEALGMSHVVYFDHLHVGGKCLLSSKSVVL